MPETESGTIINKASLSQTVSVFHINCNYLRNKMGELMMVSKTYGRYLKIICVTETMLIAEINIPNFVTCRKDRLNCREGGGSFNCSDSIVYLVLQYALKLIHILLYLFVFIVYSH